MRASRATYVLADDFDKGLLASGLERECGTQTFFPQKVPRARKRPPTITSRFTSPIQIVKRTALDLERQRIPGSEDPGYSIRTIDWVVVARLFRGGGSYFPGKGWTHTGQANTCAKM